MAPGALRVLHLLDSLSIGGTEWNAVRLLIELKRLGVHVHLAVFRDGPLRADLDRAGIPVQSLSVTSFYSLAFLREAMRLRRIIKDEGIGLLHAHDRYSNVFAAIAGLVGPSVPTVASKRWDSRGDPWRMRAASWFALRSATRVLANSEAVARSATADEAVPASKIRVIPNFVDDAVFDIGSADLRAETRAEIGLRPDQLVIVCVANLRPVKNHALLLDALAAMRPSLPGVLLLLVGDGPSRRDLERRAKELDLLEQVIFLGQRPDGWRFHAAGDLSVLASDSEGFPNALVEAQALGVPVVATAVGGVPEVVDDQVTGLLVPKGDAAGMTNALLALLRDPLRRGAMGVAARLATRTNFSREAVLERVMGFYRELLPQSGDI